MFMCVLSVPYMYGCYYMFILVETCKEGLKNVQVYILVVNVRLWLPKGLQEGPKGCQPTTFAVSIDWTKKHHVCWQNSHQSRSRRWSLILDKDHQENNSRPHRLKPQMAIRWTYWLSMVLSMVACNCSLVVVSLKGWMGNSRHVLT